jgi:DNA-binding NtrC family response regulator
MITSNQILDLLEKAYKAGCFEEVHKMIKADSSLVLIEKVIEKSQERSDRFPFNFDDIFGSD